MKTEHIVILVLAVAVAGLAYLHFGGFAIGVLSADEATQGALAFINEYMIEPGNKAELVGEVTQEKGLYKFTIALGGQEISSYITKDGAMLFPQGGIDLEKVKAEIAAGAAEENSAPKTCDDINVEKQAEPLLEAFVVSYCPYGIQMQRIITGIANGAPALANNIKIRYMGDIVDGEITAMHGEEEARENLRQICLREEQPEQFYAYLECFMEAGETEECLVSAEIGREAIDKTALNACMTDPSRGLKYAQDDFAFQDAYNVTGSPSLFLNGLKVSEFDFGGRTAQAVKTLLCCGFASEPGGCSEQLSAEQAAVSFSETYSGSGSSGSCD